MSVDGAGACDGGSAAGRAVPAPIDPVDPAVGGVACVGLLAGVAVAVVAGRCTGGGAAGGGLAGAVVTVVAGEAAFGCAGCAGCCAEAGEGGVLGGGLAGAAPTVVAGAASACAVVGATGAGAFGATAA